jgi:hypothetical protein
MKALAWLLERLKERSTWVGIVGVITAAGVNLSPEKAEAIITVGGAVVSAILVFTKDATPPAP